MFHVKQRYPFEPDYRVAPGETLKEEIDARNWPYGNVARRLCLSVARLQELLTGDMPITPLLAKRLSRLTGHSAQFWLNLEANYRAPVA